MTPFSRRAGLERFEDQTWDSALAYFPRLAVQ